jgi:hypothetical protein
MEGMLLSLTVAGAVEASHLFPEHLEAGAIITGAAFRAGRGVWSGWTARS